MRTINQEPVLTVGALVAAITAGLQWVRLMGWLHWTDEQFNQFMLFVGMVLPLVGALWARARVTPLANPRDRQGRTLSPRDEEYQ